MRTYREGVAQRVGHDLIIDVGEWEATAEVGADGTLSAVRFEADPRSLQVREGLRGLKPLTDRDRGDIRKTIDEKILGDGRSSSARLPSSPQTAGWPYAASSSSRARRGRRASTSPRLRTAACTGRCP